MFWTYVRRGVTAGIVAGLAFGLFVALVGDPLIRYAETFEAGGHGGGPVVSGAVTSLVSAAGGVLLGILLGAVVFGVGFYFLEPAIPGGVGSKSYLLAAAGFITVSGAPWVAFPPQPPGVEQGLPTEVRIMWYLVMMVTGAFACGLSGAAYNRLRHQFDRALALVGALVPFALVGIIGAIVPANPVSGPIPTGFADVFRGVTAVGQIGLWLVLASVHAWLMERASDAAPTGEDMESVAETAESTFSG